MCINIISMFVCVCVYVRACACATVTLVYSFSSHIDTISHLSIFSLLSM